MDRRTARPLAIDVVFAAAIVAVAAVALAKDGRPPIPAGVCAGEGSPRYEELSADRTIAVAALFGQIGDGPLERDFAARSRHLLEAALIDRGFVAVAADRYRLDDGAVAIDVALTGPAGLPRGFPALTAAALTDALAGHDLVYYNGHVFEGTLDFAPPAGDYRIVVLDSCWSTQRYSPRLLGPTVDVIGNSERAITGSVESFVALLDGLRARTPSWGAILAPMNQLADARADARFGRSAWDQPERYRLDVACRAR